MDEFSDPKKDLLRRLFEAIRDKEIDVIHSLIGQLGGYVNESRKTDGLNALHFAAQTGDSEILKLFTETRFVDVNVKDDLEGFTALHYVLEEKNLEGAKILIDAGANFYPRDHSGETSLHHLVEKGVDAKFIQSLLSFKVDANVKNNKGENPLFVAARIGNIEVMKVLIDFDCDIKCVSQSKSTLLHEAVKCNDDNSHFHVADLLLKKGLDVNAQDKRKNTALHCLIGNSYANVIKLSLNFAAGVNINGNRDETTVKSNINVVKLLLDNGADVNIRDEFGSTPLHKATYLPHKEEILRIYEVLLKSGAEVNVQDRIGKTPLHCLIEKSCSPEIVKLLLSYHPDANLKDNNGEIPLFYAVKNRSNGFELLQLLIDYGSNVNSFRNDGCTPLHFAATNYSDTKTMKYLIKNGADVNARNPDGQTPLLFALQEWVYSGVALLFLLEHSDVNVVDESGNNFLDFESRCSEKETCLKHLAKWQALDLPINPSIMETISNSQVYSTYFVKCKEELALAKSTKLENCWVTFFHLLTGNQRKLKNFAGNASLIEDFKKSNYKSKFPIYGSSIQKRMVKGMKRRKLFDESADLLNSVLPIFSSSHLIIRDVLDCIHTKDLSKFSD